MNCFYNKQDKCSFLNNVCPFNNGLLVGLKQWMCNMYNGDTPVIKVCSGCEGEGVVGEEVCGICKGKGGLGIMSVRGLNPSGEDCETNKLIYETKLVRGYAIWYPQMGGNVGRAIVMIDKKGDVMIDKKGDECFEVFVWHDGKHPLSEEDGDVPIRIHHCSAEQFIEFGKKVLELQNKKSVL